MHWDVRTVRGANTVLIMSIYVVIIVRILIKIDGMKNDRFNINEKWQNMIYRNNFRLLLAVSILFLVDLL
jgi:hypothetical protein